MKLALTADLTSVSEEFIRVVETRGWRVSIMNNFLLPVSNTSTGAVFQAGIAESQSLRASQGMV